MNPSRQCAAYFGAYAGWMHLITRAGRPRGLRGARRRAVRVRGALARRRRPRRGGGAGDLPARLARRRALRPRDRLAADLAVRDPAQRRHRPRPRPRGAARSSPRAGIEPSVEPLEETLLAWQVEEAMRRIGDQHREILVETYYRGRPYAEVAAELGRPRGHREEPRLLRRCGRCESRSRRWAMKTDGCREWRESLGAYALGHLSDEERAGARGPPRGLPRAAAPSSSAERAWSGCCRSPTRPASSRRRSCRAALGDRVAAAIAGERRRPAAPAAALRPRAAAAPRRPPRPRWPLRPPRRRRRRAPSSTSPSPRCRRG